MQVVRCSSQRNDTWACKFISLPKTLHVNATVTYIFISPTLDAMLMPKLFTKCMAQVIMSNSSISQGNNK